MYISSIQYRVSPDNPSGCGFSHCRSAHHNPSFRNFGSFVCDRNLQRRHSKDRVIHMMPQRPPLRLRATRHQRLKLLDQRIAQRIVMRQLRKRQRPIPRANLRVVNRLRILVRTRHKVLRQMLAHLLRRNPRRPVRKGAILRRSHTHATHQQTSQHSSNPAKSSSPRKNP